MSTLVRDVQTTGAPNQCRDNYPLVVSRTVVVKTAEDSSVTYEAKLIKFANVWQLFLTYSGKVGTWICASADSPHQSIFSTRTLIGDRLQEHLHVYARTLIKKLYDSLKVSQSLELDKEVVLILALDIENDKPETFKQIMAGLEGIFQI